MRKFIFSLIATLVTVLTIYAQPQQQRPQPQSQRDGNFTEFQLQVLTKQLKLEESKVVAFTKLYTEYSNKIEALQPKPQQPKPQQPQHRPENGNGKNENDQEDNLTDAQVEAQILESFVMAEKSTELKREYYYKFKAIITPKQILKMYNVERRMRERIVSESDRRAEGGGKK